MRRGHGRGLAPAAAALAWLAAGAGGAGEPALEVRLADIRASGLEIHDCSLRFELRNGLDIALKGFAAELILFDAGGRELARKPFEMARVGPGVLRREGLGIKLAADDLPRVTTALELQHQCDVLASAELRLRACESDRESVFDRCLAAITVAPGGALPLALAPDSAEEAVDYGVIETPRGARAEAAEEVYFPSLGATVSSITAALARSRSLSPVTEGLLVVEVAAGGAAAAAGLMAGDVVAEVDQEPVLRPQDLEEALARARAAGHRSLLVLVEGDRGADFRVVRLE